MEKSAEINEEKTSENSCHNNNNRIPSLNEGKIFEDPCFLIDRDFVDKEREGMDTDMLDAFRYEILNHSGDGMTGKLTSSNEIVVASIYTKDPLLQDMLGNGATQYLFDVELANRSHFLEELDKSTLSCEKRACGTEISGHPLITCGLQHEEIKADNFIVPNWEEEFQFVETAGIIFIVVTLFCFLNGSTFVYYRNIQ